MWSQAMQLSSLKFYDAVFGFVGALVVCMANALQPPSDQDNPPTQHPPPKQQPPTRRSFDRDGFKPILIYLAGGTLCGFLIGGTIEQPEVSSAWAVLVGAAWLPLAIQVRESGKVIVKALADHYSGR